MKTMKRVGERGPEPGPEHLTSLSSSGPCQDAAACLRWLQTCSPGETTALLCVTLGHAPRDHGQLSSKIPFVLFLLARAHQGVWVG